MPSLSPLAQLSIERNAWRDVEKLARGYRDKKLHAHAVKMVKSIGELMVDKGHDEMEMEDESDTAENPDNENEGIF